MTTNTTELRWRPTDASLTLAEKMDRRTRLLEQAEALVREAQVINFPITIKPIAECLTDEALANNPLPAYTIAYALPSL